MITVTMMNIIDFRNNINFLQHTSVPLKAAYKINKIKQALDKEFDFYSTKFQEIVDKYAQKDDNNEPAFSEDGSQILIKDGEIENCNKELEDLQNLEVEIDNYGFTIDDLGDDVACTPEQLAAVMPFME